MNPRTPSLTHTLGAILTVLLIATTGATAITLPPETPEPLTRTIETVHTQTTDLPDGHALIVTIDFTTDQMTLRTLPADETTTVVQNAQNDPNCLATQRSSWVQRGEPLNLNTATDTPVIPGGTGHCQWWKPNQGGIEQLTFLLVERVGGSVDAVDEPTESFIVVECERSGFNHGPLNTGKQARSITCEYRNGGQHPTDWTFWDSLMNLQGQTVAGTGYGFGYAKFE